MKSSSAKKGKVSPAMEGKQHSAAVLSSATVRTPSAEELKKAIAEEKAKLTRTLDILAKN